VRRIVDLALADVDADLAAALHGDATLDARKAAADALENPRRGCRDALGLLARAPGTRAGSCASAAATRKA
jgi:hypothetical protein